MRILRLLSCIAMLPVCAQAEDGNPDYQKILEAKYQTPLERLRVLDFSPTTKVLGFDFELFGDKSWWGGFNVIEVDHLGVPRYWHDIPQPPAESGIESLRVVDLHPQKYLEVVAASHQGNGRLYLYELQRGVLQLVLDLRIMTNLNSMHFTPSTTKIAYRDLDADGDVDLIVNATCFEGQIMDESGEVVGHYQRVFHNRNGTFVEQLGERSGASVLMD